MSWTHTRSQIANAKRLNPDADVLELRRKLKGERLADYIAQRLAEAPPLSEDQRRDLAVLLRGGGAA